MRSLREMCAHACSRIGLCFVDLAIAIESQDTAVAEHDCTDEVAAQSPLSDAARELLAVPSPRVPHTPQASPPLAGSIAARGKTPL